MGCRIMGGTRMQSIDGFSKYKKMIRRGLVLAVSFAGAVSSTLFLLGLMTTQSAAEHVSSVDARTAESAPIPPPEGYPKLSLSTKTVTPTLAEQDGAVLYYTIEIRNTGAATATNTTFVDTLPPEVAYNGDCPEDERLYLFAVTQDMAGIMRTR